MQLFTKIKHKNKTETPKQLLHIDHRPGRAVKIGNAPV